MLRRVFSLSALLSLIVLVAICAVWVRSFYRTDQQTRLTPTAFYEVMSSAGTVVLYRLEPPDGEVRWVRPAVTHSVLGTEVIEGRLARRRPWRLLLVPYWVPAGFATILPAAWLAARARREAKSRVAQCPICGTALSSPDASCPTCPAVVGARPDSAGSVRPAAASTEVNPRPVAYRRAV